jgi:hypothetical protein
MPFFLQPAANAANTGTEFNAPNLLKILMVMML